MVIGEHSSDKPFHPVRRAFAQNGFFYYIFKKSSVVIISVVSFICHGQERRNGVARNVSSLMNQTQAQPAWEVAALATQPRPPQQNGLTTLDRRCYQNMLITFLVILVNST